MSSRLRLLLDENQERRSAESLAESGHDVEMVVDALEPGVADETIATYAREQEQVVVTADQDFLSIDVPTLFQVDDRTEGHEVARIVDRVAERLTQDQIETYGHVKLVEDWL